MCDTCGCSDNSRPRLTNLQSGATLEIGSANEREHEHEHHHHHTHVHSPEDAHHHGHDHRHHHHDDDQHHHHDHDHSQRTTVRLETEVLARNNRLAERNRGWLAGRGIVALNLMSSPGAGKTTLLERTIRDLGGDLALSVIEGDQETTRDAERIRATGSPVVQINTGTGCHLDAVMLARGLEQLNPPMNSMVLIENVGNLVCPALFDLGEHARVVIVSVTEGEDKPIKYPHMFRESDVVVLSKIDLLPHVPFDLSAFLDHVRQVNPLARIVQVSALTGEGLAAWYDWVRGQTSGIMERA
jgi:hydrogenase nickel incorporation protein HypB